MFSNDEPVIELFKLILSIAPGSINSERAFNDATLISIPARSSMSAQTLADFTHAKCFLKSLSEQKYITFMKFMEEQFKKNDDFCTDESESDDDEEK